MPFIQAADDTEIFYNDWGTGKPVVLVHGWPLDADMWEFQSLHLAENGFRVIAYDRRGFGRSSQPYSGYDYDTMAADLKAIVDGLDLRDAALVGFSMGGGEVARYIGTYGTERVSHAALISAVTPFLLKTADNPDGVDKSVFDGIVEGLRKDRPAFLAGFGKTFFGAGLLSSVSNEVLAWAQQMALLASPKATLDCVRAFSETDFRADLAKFSAVKTLIIHGDADKTVPLDHSAKPTAKLIPGADFRVYEGEPHALTHTAKDKLNADLLSFLRN